jgi:hypothetical protein
MLAGLLVLCELEGILKTTGCYGAADSRQCFCGETRCEVRLRHRVDAADRCK